MKTKQTGPPDPINQAAELIAKARRNIGVAWTTIERAKLQLAQSKRRLRY